MLTFMNSRVFIFFKRSTPALGAIATLVAWFGLSGYAFAQSASFDIGISLDGGTTFVSSAMKSDTVLIRGRIHPEIDNIGQSADIFVVDYLAKDNSLVMGTTSGAWVPWDGSVSTLQPFLEDQLLTATFDLDLFTGTVGRTGTHRIFLGYRAADGILRYNVDGFALAITQPIED